MFSSMLLRTDTRPKEILEHENDPAVTYTHTHTLTGPLKLSALAACSGCSAFHVLRGAMENLKPVCLAAQGLLVGLSIYPQTRSPCKNS